MMPRAMGLSNRVSSDFLITPFFVTMTMYFSGTNSFTARKARISSFG